MTIEYAQRDQARSEDSAFFDRYPDREYRLRRAWRSEHGEGEPPAGYAVFAIVYRRANNLDAEYVFGAPITLETDQPGAGIRELASALSVDPKVLLKTK